MRRLALSTVLALAIVAPAADAATIEVNGAALKVDVPAAANQTPRTGGKVTLLPDGGALVSLHGVFPSGSLSVGNGCASTAASNASELFMANYPSQAASFAATCTMTDVRVLDVALRSNTGPQGWLSTLNLPTRVTAIPNVQSAANLGDVVTTGGGGDTITTTGGPDFIDPGGVPKKGQAPFPATGNTNIDDPGVNTVTAGDGNDSIELSRALGPDVVNGGGGTDLVTYATRFGTVGSPGALGVRVTLDGTANDGDQDINAPDANPAERDNIKADVENLIGTKLDDFLEGGSTANRIEGLDGVDTLRGLSGQDVIVSREPAAAGSGTADSITCGLSNQFGTPANPRGSPSVPPDRLESDLADPRPLDCEDIVQMAVDEPAPVRFGKSAKRDGRKLKVALTCPRAAERTCKGALRFATKGDSQTTDYTLRPGAKGKVVVRLTKSQARSLAGKKVTARIEAAETGNQGDILSLRYVRVVN